MPVADVEFIRLRGGSRSARDRFAFPHLLADRNFPLTSARDMATMIRSLKASGGYLENATVEFHPGLTCIIGARGTCKSTVVETIRFAFDCDPERVQRVLLGDPRKQTGDPSPLYGVILETLGQNSVWCEVREVSVAGESKLTIERDVHAKPRVYREGIQELADTGVLNRIEIYSQGDLQRIAENDRLRLELIDRPHKIVIADLLVQRDRNIHTLREAGLQLRKKRAEIETRRADVKGLTELRGQLAELRESRPQLSRELDEEREGYLKRKGVLDRLRAGITARKKLLDDVLTVVGQDFAVGSLAADAQAAGLPEGELVAQELERFREFVGEVRQNVQDRQKANLDEQLTAANERAETENARYYQLRQEQQTVNDSLKREDTLKNQIVHLERLEAELERFLLDEQQLFESRRSARESLQRISDQIYRLRLQEVDQINSQHSEVILLTLEQGARSPGYREKLSAMLQGSRLRNQEDVVRDLAQKVRPSDLVDICEAGDSRRLADLLDRDLGQMARLVAHLLDSATLYDLEGVIAEDRLEITMYDGDVPKPVGQLSKGQMATALLPLILRPAEYPLVFDQPEDDLDNRFIFTTLVECVRELKTRRQIIFVTHNANIPVLGEADTVIVMRMENPTKADTPISGTVDEARQHILTLLEGGADAFRRRHHKYRDLLN